MGFIDLDRYDPDLGGALGKHGRLWTPQQVLERALRHVNDGHAFFWGSAEADNKIKINPDDFDQLRSSALQRFHGMIEVSAGRLCLTGSQSLAAIAQLVDEDKLPFWQDFMWQVLPGWYMIDVVQFSRYDGSAQCIGDVDSKFEDGSTHHAIRIERVKSGHRKRCKKIPNQPDFYYPKKRK
jgi:hypothetical protein